MNKIKINKHSSILIINDYIIIDGSFIIHKNYCEFDNKIFNKLIKKETLAQIENNEIKPLQIVPNGWENLLKPSNYNDKLPIKPINLWAQEEKMESRYFMIEDTNNKIIMATMQELYYTYLPNLTLYYSPDKELFTIWDMKREFNKIVGVIAPTKIRNNFIINIVTELNAYREKEAS